MNKIVILATAVFLLDFETARSSVPDRHAFYEDERIEGVADRYFRFTDLFQEAMSAFRNAEYDSALALFSQADLITPNEGLLWHMVAQVHHAKGDEERAREAAYHLLECYFGSNGFFSRFSYSARNLREIGAIDEALAVWEAGMTIAYAKGDAGSYIRLLRAKARYLRDFDRLPEAVNLLAEAGNHVASWDFRQELLELLQQDPDEKMTSKSSLPGYPMGNLEIERDGKVVIRSVLPDLPGGPSKMTEEEQREALDKIAAGEKALAEMLPEWPGERLFEPVLDRVLYIAPGRELWILNTENEYGTAYAVEPDSTLQPGTGMRIVGPYGYYKEPLTSQER